MRICYGACVLALVCVTAVAHADYTRVTLAYCGDLSAEELQAVVTLEAPSIEGISISCHGDAATVRMTGAQHPRGQIMEIELSDVDEVARPRTIAIVASQRWVSRNEPATTEKVVALAPPIAMFGNGANLSLSMGLASRKLQRPDLPGIRANSSLMTVRADIPVGPARLFASVGSGLSMKMATASGDFAKLHWKREELGFYVPLRLGLLRLSPRLAVGSDRIRAKAGSETLVLAPPS